MCAFSKEVFEETKRIVENFPVDSWSWGEWDIFVDNGEVLITDSNLELIAKANAYTQEYICMECDPDDLLSILKGIK